MDYSGEKMQSFIAYKGNDTLYIPVENFKLVRKYASRDGKWQIVRHLKKCDIKILEEYGINFYPIKYKIYLRA